MTNSPAFTEIENRHRFALDNLRAASVVLLSAGLLAGS